jgi:methionyl-tRNA formyltransferase
VVVTRPDKRRGRGAAAGPTAVKQLAQEKGIPVSHDISVVTSVGAELGVVVAYGRIIKPDVLAALKMVNLHFSLLPRWRGAAPVERAILAGDATTGVCIMDVEEGLDTGGVYRRLEVPIGPEDTAAELTDRLARLGADLLVETLAEGLGAATPQTGEPTYAAKVEPGELRLDWGRPAEELHRVVRVGRAWTTFRGRRLLVLEARVDPTPASLPPGTLDGDRAHTGSARLQLVTVQPEGRRPQPAAEWLHGARPGPGDRLGE